MKSIISPKVEIRKSGINKKGMFAKELIKKDEIFTNRPFLLFYSIICNFLCSFS